MKNLYKSLAEFQQEVPVILKDTSGYNYKYADLPAIDEVIKPLLKKHGLGVLQPLSNIGGVQAIKTIIYHSESGESMEDITPLPQTKMEKVGVFTKEGEKKGEKFVVCGFEQMSEPQAQGSIITYYRRYALSSFLGLITDKDTDASGNTAHKGTNSRQASGNDRIDDLDL